MTLGLVSGLSVVITFGTGFGWLLQSLSRHSKFCDLELISYSNDVLSNIRTVKLFTTEEYEIGRMKSLQDSAAKSNRLFCTFMGVFDGLSELLNSTVVGSVLIIGCTLVTKDFLTLGDLFGFLNSASSIQKSMAQTASLQSSLRKMKESLNMFSEHIKNEPESDGLDLKHEIIGSVECKALQFAYPNRDNAVSDLNLTINPGLLIGICGPSGSGKSTLAALLTRLYDPPNNSLLIDGIDVNTLDKNHLRKQIGLINQDPSLFEGTIEENIRYGSPEATDDEVMVAADLANVTEFVGKLPNGFNTHVGSKGLALSGGQKQRIAIARTILKNPRILILDEATSALDSKIHNFLCRN